MRIAIFDYLVVPTNPAGSCHRRVLEGACWDHEITVFAVEFDNPCPDRIRIVRIPAIRRPLVALFVSYHILASLVYLWHRLRGQRFDLVQGIESKFAFLQVCYSHFCHREYLASHFGHSGCWNLRNAARWLDHWLHATVEPLVYRRARIIVVPSQGLRRELLTAYPYTADKVRLIYNPVDTVRMKMPPGFDRAGERAALGFAPKDLVLVFVALGHFERKGLHLLLEAMRMLQPTRAKVLVVGGKPDVVENWRNRVRRLGVEDHVRFAGMRSDVRPFLWSSDAFVLPSAYEVFPLVALEAAAAGLPLLSTPVNGVVEFLSEGRNGHQLSQVPAEIAQVIERISRSSQEQLHQLGLHAAEDVERFGVASFTQAWNDLYYGLDPSEQSSLRCPASSRIHASAGGYPPLS